MKVIVGIDIAKAKFDVALLIEEKFKTKVFSNTAKGFSALSNWLEKHTQESVHACLEATGVYGDKLAEYLVENDVYVSVVNPAQIKAFGTCQLSRNKTDKADAKLIAQFCKAIKPKAWEPLPASIKELRALVRRLEDLQQMYQQDKNRLDVANDKVKPSIKTMLEQIQENINEIKKSIKDKIDNDPDLKNKKDLLDSIPGVGEATISQVLAFLSDIQAFRSAKQMAAYVGVTPKQRQSGSSIRGKTTMSKMGDSSLRKALYLPAITAKKHNPIINAFCQNLLDRGKPVMSVIGAAMRKLIHIIYGVLKSGKPFDPQWIAKNA